jgi:hypothetical protein
MQGEIPRRENAMDPKPFNDDPFFTMLVYAWAFFGLALLLGEVILPYFFPGW